jgi:hypothetical protein
VLETGVLSAIVSIHGWKSKSWTIATMDRSMPLVPLLFSTSSMVPTAGVLIPIETCVFMEKLVNSKKNDRKS